MDFIYFNGLGNGVINHCLHRASESAGSADSIYDTVVPENPNLAQKAVPTVSSETLATNPAGYLIDGSERNQWVTEGTEVPCWAKLSWDEPWENAPVR